MTVYPFIGFAEPFSAMSHFVGALICVVGGVSLLKTRGLTAAHRAALITFCFGCFFLLLMSGLFHLLPLESSGRAVLQRLDRAAIFVLIAGTFTPIHVIRFRGFWRWGPLSFIWFVAITGIVLTSVFFRDIPEYLSLSTYLGMGWFGVVTATLLWLQSGFALVKPLLSGAIAYSVGALTEFFRIPVLINGVLGPHELFHIAVLIGIAFHWKLVRQLLTVEMR